MLASVVLASVVLASVVVASVVVYHVMNNILSVLDSVVG